jgi:hypothetical protein
MDAAQQLIHIHRGVDERHAGAQSGGSDRAARFLGQHAAPEQRQRQIGHRPHRFQQRHHALGAKLRQSPRGRGQQQVKRRRRRWRRHREAGSIDPGPHQKGARDACRPQRCQ